MSITAPVPDTPKRKYRHWYEAPPPPASEFSIPEALLGPAPCDGCRSAPRCAAEKLACSAFAVYADGTPESRWAAAPRLDASAARYRVIYRVPTARAIDRRPARSAGSARS